MLDSYILRFKNNTEEIENKMMDYSERLWKSEELIKNLKWRVNTEWHNDSFEIIEKLPTIKMLKVNMSKEVADAIRDQLSYVSIAELDETGEDEGILIRPVDTKIIE